MVRFEVGKTYIHYNGYDIKRMTVIRRSMNSIRVNIDGDEMTLRLRQDTDTEYVSRKTYDISAKQAERNTACTQ